MRVPETGGGSRGADGRAPGSYRRLVCLLLCLQVATTLLVACGAPLTGRRRGPTVALDHDGLQIGVSLDELDELRRAELEAIQAQARIANAVTWSTVANGSAEQQQTQIHELITGRRVDAVIVIPQDRTRIVRSILEANRAGVPIVVLDRAAAPGGDVAFQVTGDPVADGMHAGRYLAGLGRPLAVLHLWGAIDDPEGRGRRDGFERAVAGTQLRVVATAPAGWDPAKAAAATLGAFRRDRRLDAVFVPSGSLLPAVLDALRQVGRLRQAGRPAHVVVVAVGGDPVGRQALAQGLTDAEVVTPVELMARQAFQAAVSAVRRAPIAPRQVTIAGEVITRAEPTHSGHRG